MHFGQRAVVLAANQSAGVDRYRFALPTLWEMPAADQIARRIGAVMTVQSRQHGASGQRFHLCLGEHASTLSDFDARSDQPSHERIGKISVQACLVVDAQLCQHVAEFGARTEAPFALLLEQSDRLLEFAAMGAGQQQVVSQRDESRVARCGRQFQHRLVLKFGRTKNCEQRAQ